MKSKMIIFLVFLLFVCLAGLMVWRYQVSAVYRETATKTLFQPYFDAVLKNKLNDAYENFTDDYYKSEFALDDYLAAHDKVLTENGKFTGYEISTFRQCGGIFSFRALVCASVVLKFERGDQVFEYQIQQGANEQFRIRYSGRKNKDKIDGFPF